MNSRLVRLIAAVLPIVIFAGACVKKQQPPSVVEVMEVKAAIDTLWTAYAYASDQRNAEAFGALFTEDATLALSGAPTVHGRDSIRTFLAAHYAGIDPTGLSVEPDETRTSGPIAVQGGSFEESFIEKEATKTKYARYVLVAEQGTDRAWRIRRIAAITDSIK